MNISRPEHLYKIAAEDYSKVDTINISHFKISNDDFLMICNFTNLKNLILQGCSIKKIPKDIKNLKKLHFLDLSMNCIEEIPDEVFMINPSYLKLRWNAILKLPRKISEIKFLFINYDSYKDINKSKSELLVIDFLNRIKINFNPVLKELHLRCPYMDYKKLKLPYGTKMFINKVNY
jgi:Leucine-rich repeat (LRR) protein